MCRARTRTTTPWCASGAPTSFTPVEPSVATAVTRFGRRRLAGRGGRGRRRRGRGGIRRLGRARVVALGLDVRADEDAPASTADLKASRDALVTIRARVQKLIDEGKSEDLAVATKPTKDFDAKWVHQGNFVTGDTMTRLAYQSLKGVRPPTTP